MSRVIIRPQAVQDVRDLWLYLADHASPEQADRVVEQIRQKLELASAYPYMGRSREELRPHVRSLVIGRYVAFYIPLDDGIEVIRVLYGGRDLPALLAE